MKRTLIFFLCAASISLTIGMEKGTPGPSIETAASKNPLAERAQRLANTEDLIRTSAAFYRYNLLQCALWIDRDVEDMEIKNGIREWIIASVQRPEIFQDAFATLVEAIDLHRNQKEKRREMEAMIQRLLELTGASLAQYYDPERVPYGLAHKTVEQPALLKLVLDAGANPDARDQHGNSPLHWACDKRMIGSVNVLLDHGADPNISNTRFPWCQTPLLCTVYSFNTRPKARRDYLNIAYTLLMHPKNGADVACVNTDGLAAGDIMRRIPRDGTSEQYRLKTLLNAHY